MPYKLPSTIINLYAGVEIAAGLQQAFSSRSAQNNYFSARRTRQITGATLVNGLDGSVRISGDLSGVIGCNYISFINQLDGNKLYFCEILDFRWSSTDSVEVFFAVDSYQTYMFDFAMRSGMIEREHLTQAQQTATEASPYEQFQIEMMTDEGLSVTKDLEVVYRRNRGLVDESLTPAGSPTGDAPFEPGGTAGLVQEFGGSRYGDDDTRYPTAIVTMIAASEDVQEAVLEWQDLSGTVTRIVSYPSARLGISMPYFSAIIQGPTEASATAIEMGAALQELVDGLTQRGLDAAIISMFNMPVTLLDNMIGLKGDYGPINVDVESVSYGTCIGYEPVMKKLYRSPFRSVRVVSPRGDVHNYVLERGSGSPGTMRLVLAAGIYEVPTQILAPALYDGQSVNFDEKMVYTDFPQVPYITDGYLTYLASVYQQAITNDTLGQKEARGSGFNVRYDPSKATGMGMGGGIGQFSAEFGQGGINLQDIGDSFQSAMGMMGNALTGNLAGAQAAVSDMGRDTEISRNAYSFLKGDTPKSNPLANHADAYQLDNYHAGNSMGAVALQTLNNWWRAELVTLRRGVIEAYDRYLQAYGYKSTRIGIPRIFSWTRGGALPHFVSLDGMATTYCQTSGAKVTGIPIPAARAVEGLFDGGCRFANGG